MQLPHCEINYKIIQTYNVFQRVKVLWCEHICMYLYGEQQSEETIVEETCYLWEAFEKFQGKIILLHFWTFWSKSLWSFTSDFIFPAGNPFEMTQPKNYVGSNIISAIVYVKWFEYKHPRFVKQGKRFYCTFLLFIIVINLTASSSLQTNRYSWCVSTCWSTTCVWFLVTGWRCGDRW